MPIISVAAQLNYLNDYEHKITAKIIVHPRRLLNRRRRPLMRQTRKHSVETVVVVFVKMAQAGISPSSRLNHSPQGQKHTKPNMRGYIPYCV